MADGAITVGSPEPHPKARKNRLARVLSILPPCGAHKNLLPGMAALPRDRVRLGAREHVIGLFAAILVLCVYTTCLGPTITGEDSGELVTAAYTLGIAHPPGYPLWCLIGKIFTLVPYGSVAWRVSLMSAVLGAVTVYLLYLFIVKLTGSILSGIVGAGVFGFSAEFWEQSTIPEVYSLNTLFVVTCTLLLYLWYEKRHNWLLYLFAFAYGLSLTNHNTMLLLGPIYIAFVTLVDRRFWERWPTYICCTLLSLSALTVYLYLPIRAASDPPVNWGDPSTWQSFWDVVQRKQYAFGFLKNPRTLQGFVTQFQEFLRIYVWEFGPWLAWIPIVGLIALWRRNRYAFALVTGIAIVSSLGMIFLLNFEIDRQSLWLNNVFWIPAYCMFAVLLAMAVNWVQEQASSRESKPLLAGAAILMISSPVLLHYNRNDKSNYYFADDFARNILATLDENAIYFPSADHATFPIIYLQVAEGLRPDVTLANKYGYPEWALYKSMPIEKRSGFQKIPNKQQELAIEDWIIENSVHPIYFSARRPMDGLPGYELAQRGLVFRVIRPGEDKKEEFDWEKYSWHTLRPEDTGGELTADFILGDYYYMRGRDLLVNGQQELATAEFDIAIRVAGESKETLNNIGSSYAEAGVLQQGEQYLRKAVALDDEYDLALKNLAKIYMQQSDDSSALLQWEKLVKLNPQDTEAVWNSAECMKSIEWNDDAIARFEYLLNLTPDDPRVYRELGFLYLNHKRNLAKSQLMFRESLRIDPNQPELVQATNQVTGQGQEGMGPQIPGLPGLPSVPSPAIPQLPQVPTGQTIPQVPGLPNSAGY